MQHTIESTTHKSFNESEPIFTSYIYHKTVNKVLKVVHGNICQARLFTDFNCRGFKISRDLPKYILKNLNGKKGL